MKHFFSLLSIYNALGNVLMACNVCGVFVQLLHRDIHFMSTLESEAVTELKYCNK
jgi:hypothetical protein